MRKTVNILGFIMTALVLVLVACTNTTKPTDLDKDGWSKEDGDCDDLDDTIYPGALDILKDCNDSNDSSASSSFSSGTDSSTTSSSSSSSLKSELIIMRNFIPQPTAGKVNQDFFNAINAQAIYVNDSSISNAKLIVEAGTVYPKETLYERPKSLGIGIYIGVFDKNTLRAKAEYTRFLDAEWKGNCNNLNIDNAQNEGGVYFFGQIRHLEFNLNNPLPVSKENKCETGKEEIDLLSLIKNSKQRGEFVMIGFYSSGAPYGLIREVKMLYEGGEMFAKDQF